MLFPLITLCVVPNSTVGTLSRSSNIFFTIFPVPSSLLYPSALWVSMRCFFFFFFPQYPREIAIGILCFTNEEEEHRKIEI